MATFEIKGKEHELKLNYAGIKYLNKKVDGGALAVVGQAMQGDEDLIPHIISAALRHTGEEYKLKDIESAIEQAVEEERLDLLGLLRLSNEVVTDNFFYKAAVTKMMADTPEAKAALDNLLK
ncbi:tail assembly chaperone [Bacillus sp. FSL K6-3431]|uniref:tail assembly chaperone n=1 Tax=Bacillus sp. FSL K6-3431 TaxID=2921500 RepID=UPI0030FB39BE